MLSNHLTPKTFIAHPLGVDHFAANLPDYDVGQLRAWLRLYFHKPTTTAYFVQSIVGSVFSALILIFGCVVIFYRLWDRTLWLFRFQETRGSVLIIPNSTTSFVLLVALYTVFWQANVWHNLAIDKLGADPSMTGFWNGPVFILLFSGAWLGAWGTFFASPGILHSNPKPRGFDARRLLPGPRTCNFIGLFVPLSFVVVNLSLSIKTGVTYRAAVARWKLWDADAAQRVPSTFPIPDALKQDAALVWEGITLAWWWTTVVWLAALIFAWSFLVCYLPTGGHLLYTIITQLQSLDRRTPVHSAQLDAAASQAPQWHTCSPEKLAAEMEFSRAKASTFFPAMGEKGTTTVSAGSSGKDERVALLRSALLNVGFIYISVVLGCVGFIVAGHWLLAQQYQKAVLGPVELNRVYETYMALDSWVGSTFIFICFSTIALKTFEGVFAGQSDFPLPFAKWKLFRRLGIAPEQRAPAAPFRGAISGLGLDEVDSSHARALHFFGQSTDVSSPASIPLTLTPDAFARNRTSTRPPTRRRLSVGVRTGLGITGGGGGGGGSPPAAHRARQREATHVYSLEMRDDHEKGSTTTTADLPDDESTNGVVVHRAVTSTSETLWQVERERPFGWDAPPSAIFAPGVRVGSATRRSVLDGRGPAPTNHELPSSAAGVVLDDGATCDAFSSHWHGDHSSDTDSVRCPCMRCREAPAALDVDAPADGLRMSSIPTSPSTRPWDALGPPDQGPASQASPTFGTAPTFPSAIGGA